MMKVKDSKPIKFFLCIVKQNIKASMYFLNNFSIHFNCFGLNMTNLSKLLTARINSVTGYISISSWYFSGGSFYQVTPLNLRKVLHLCACITAWFKSNGSFKGRKLVKLNATDSLKLR